MRVNKLRQSPELERYRDLKERNSQKTSPPVLALNTLTTMSTWTSDFPSLGISFFICKTGLEQMTSEVPFLR